MFSHSSTNIAALIIEYALFGLSIAGVIYCAILYTRRRSPTTPRDQVPPTEAKPTSSNDHEQILGRRRYDQVLRRLLIVGLVAVSLVACAIAHAGIGVGFWILVVIGIQAATGSFDSKRKKP